MSYILQGKHLMDTETTELRTMLGYLKSAKENYDFHAHRAEMRKRDLDIELAVSKHLMIASNGVVPTEERCLCESQALQKKQTADEEAMEARKFMEYHHVAVKEAKDTLVSLAQHVTAMDMNINRHTQAGLSRTSADVL
ncbi:hypothetical protein M758_UG013000 [Ceratodon purpureus]|nr:hypothetical protein M758_UG013000 [Ceratodon purpureus]